MRAGFLADVRGRTCGAVRPRGGIDLTPVTVSLPAHVSVHTVDVFELAEPRCVFSGGSSTWC